MLSAVHEQPHLGDCCRSLRMPPKPETRSTLERLGLGINKSNSPDSPPPSLPAIRIWSTLIGRETGPNAIAQIWGIKAPSFDVEFSQGPRRARWTTSNFYKSSSCSENALLGPTQHNILEVFFGISFTTSWRKTLSISPLLGVTLRTQMGSHTHMNISAVSKSPRSLGGSTANSDSCTS